MGDSAEEYPRPEAVVTALAMTQAAGGESVLFAASTAGMSRSKDRGRTWTSISPSTGLGLITALAPSVDFAANATIFAGTGDGVSRSTDGGHTWHSTLQGGQVFAVATVPGLAGDDEIPGGDASVVFAGTEADGVYRSNDGGVTWAAVNAGLLDLTVLDIAFSPAFTEDGTGFVATTSGLYRTRNGGKAWRELDLGFDEPAVQCLAVSLTFNADGLVLAGTEEHGLLRSDDAGASWRPVPKFADRGVIAVAFSPRASTVAVATDRGIAISRDQRETWIHAGDEIGAALCVLVASDGVADIVIAGLVDGGMACSENGGGWARVDPSAS